MEPGLHGVFELIQCIKLGEPVGHGIKDASHHSCYLSAVQFEASKVRQHMLSTLHHLVEGVQSAVHFLVDRDHGSSGKPQFLHHWTPPNLAKKDIQVFPDSCWQRNCLADLHSCPTFLKNHLIDT